MISFHGVRSDSSSTLARQLRRADAALDENDRRLDDRQARVGGHERDVEQERVAVRDDAIERQPGQRFAAPAAIAGGDVAHVQAGDSADVEVGELAQDDPAQRPVHHADAVEVSRADDEIGAAQRPARSSPAGISDRARGRRPSGRRSRSRCRWRDETLRGRTRRARAGPVRCSADTRPGKLHAELVGDLAGAVRRLIVEHHDRHARNRHQIRHENRDVVLLVVRGDQDQRFLMRYVRRPSNRSVEICSETRPTRMTITENISSSTAPFGMRAW